MSSNSSIQNFSSNFKRHFGSHYLLLFFPPVLVIEFCKWKYESKVLGKWCSVDWKWKINLSLGSNGKTCAQWVSQVRSMMWWTVQCQLRSCSQYDNSCPEGRFPNECRGRDVSIAPIICQWDLYECLPFTLWKTDPLLSCHKTFFHLALLKHNSSSLHLDRMLNLFSWIINIKFDLPTSSIKISNPPSCSKWNKQKNQGIIQIEKRHLPRPKGLC